MASSISISVVLVVWATFAFPYAATIMSVAAYESPSLELEAEAIRNSGWWNTNNTNNTSGHCKWPTIACDKAGSVTSISLPYNYNVRQKLGKLNFSCFPNLIHLGLCGSGLYGRIPSEIGALSKLAYLDLSQNELSVVGKWNSCRLVISWDIYTVNAISNSSKGAQMQNYSNVTMGSSSSFSPSISSGSYQQSKQVWIRTESKQVMTAAVERGWNTFIFSSRCRELAHEWSSTALICPLFIEEGELFDSEKRRVATISEVSSTEDLQQLQPADEQAENVIINLLDWQVIPAENIVAAFQC